MTNAPNSSAPRTGARTRFRYGLSGLMALVGAIALACAPVAWVMAQIRAEDQAAAEIALALGSEQHFPARISRTWPDNACLRLLYYMAGSDGMVTSVSIKGEKSAQAVTRHRAALRNMTWLDIAGSPQSDEPVAIGQDRIPLAHRRWRLDRLNIHGNFAADVQLDRLAQAAAIQHLEIDCETLAPSIIRQLPSLPVESLTILCTHADRLPSDGFVTFASSKFRYVQLMVAVDDRGLEYIARAPELEGLTIEPVAFLDPPLITDAGLQRASAHLRASCLSLQATRITDESVPCIAQMRRLRLIDLRHSCLTPQGVDRLKRLRPDLTVYE